MMKWWKGKVQNSRMNSTDQISTVHGSFGISVKLEIHKKRDLTFSQRASQFHNLEWISTLLNDPHTFRKSMNMQLHRWQMVLSTCHMNQLCAYGSSHEFLYIWLTHTCRSSWEFLFQKEFLILYIWLCLIRILVVEIPWYFTCHRYDQV